MIFLTKMGGLKLRIAALLVDKTRLRKLLWDLPLSMNPAYKNLHSYSSIERCIYQSGRQLIRRFIGHSGYITAIVVDSDTKRFVSCSDNVAILWDIASGDILHILRHKENIRGINFTIDNSKILCVSEPVTVTLWDSYTGKLIFSHPFEKREYNSYKRVEIINFYDFERITGSDEIPYEVHVTHEWLNYEPEACTDDLTCKLSNSDHKNLCSIDYSEKPNRDKKFLNMYLVPSANGTINLYELFQEDYTSHLFDTKTIWIELYFLSRNKVVCSIINLSKEENFFTLYDIEAGIEESISYEYYSQLLNSHATISDYSIEWRNLDEIRVYDNSSQKCIHRVNTVLIEEDDRDEMFPLPPDFFRKRIDEIALSRDAKYAIVAYQEESNIEGCFDSYKLEFLDFNKEEFIKFFKLDGYFFESYFDSIYVYRQDSHIRVFDIVSKAYITTPSIDVNLVPYDSIMQKIIHRDKDDYRVNCLDISSDEKFLLSASMDRTLKLWSMQTGELILIILGRSPMISCAFSPDNITIAAGDTAGQVYFLRLENPDMSP